MDFQGISDWDERTQRNIVVSAFDGLNRGLPNPKLFRECLVGVAAVPADFGQVSGKYVKLFVEIHRFTSRR